MTDFFPTVEEFEQNKDQYVPIIKWRELPENVIYHVNSVGKFDTPSKFVSTSVMYGVFHNKKGELFKVWLPERLCGELVDYAFNNMDAFVRSKGLKQSEKNSERNFFDYDIMWR